MNRKHNSTFAGLLLGCGFALGITIAHPAGAQSQAAAKTQTTATQVATAQTAPAKAAAPVAAPAPAAPQAATASPTDSAVPAYAAPSNAATPAVLQGDDKTMHDFIGAYKKCVRSPTRLERLSCYDDIAQRMNIMTPEQKGKEDQILGTYGFWRVIFTRDELGRDRTFVRLESSEPVQNNAGISTRPALTISCVAEKTDVYLDWKYLLNSDENRKTLPVVFSIDSFPSVQQSWQLSNDNYAVYAPDPAKMIRAMRDHLRMIVTMTAENEPTVSLNYELPGLDNAIKILIRRCYPQGVNPTQGIAGASNPAHPAFSHETVPDNMSRVPVGAPPSMPGSLR